MAVSLRTLMRQSLKELQAASSFPYHLSDVRFLLNYSPSSTSMADLRNNVFNSLIDPRTHSPVDPSNIATQSRKELRSYLAKEKKLDSEQLQKFFWFVQRMQKIHKSRKIHSAGALGVYDDILHISTSDLFPFTTEFLDLPSSDSPHVMIAKGKAIPTRFIAATHNARFEFDGRAHCDAFVPHPSATEDDGITPMSSTKRSVRVEYSIQAFDDSVSVSVVNSYYCLLEVGVRADGASILHEHVGALDPFSSFQVLSHIEKDFFDDGVRNVQAKEHMELDPPMVSLKAPTVRELVFSVDSSESVVLVRGILYYKAVGIDHSFVDAAVEMATFGPFRIESNVG